MYAIWNYLGKRKQPEPDTSQDLSNLEAELNAASTLNERAAIWSRNVRHNPGRELSDNLQPEASAHEEPADVNEGNKLPSGDERIGSQESDEVSNGSHVAGSAQSSLQDIIDKVQLNGPIYPVESQDISERIKIMPKKYNVSEEIDPTIDDAEPTQPYASIDLIDVVESTDDEGESTASSSDLNDSSSDHESEVDQRIEYENTSPYSDSDSEEEPQGVDHLGRSSDTNVISCEDHNDSISGESESGRAMIPLLGFFSDSEASDLSSDNDSLSDFSSDNDSLSDDDVDLSDSSVDEFDSSDSSGFVDGLSGFSSSSDSEEESNDDMTDDGGSGTKHLHTRCKSSAEAWNSKEDTGRGHDVHKKLSPVEFYDKYIYCKDQDSDSDSSDESSGYRSSRHSDRRYHQHEFTDHEHVDHRSNATHVLFKSGEHVEHRQKRGRHTHFSCSDDEE